MIIFVEKKNCCIYNAFFLLMFVSHALYSCCCLLYLQSYTWAFIFFPTTLKTYVMQYDWRCKCGKISQKDIFPLFFAHALKSNPLQISLISHARSFACAARVLLHAHIHTRTHARAHERTSAQVWQVQCTAHEHKLRCVGQIRVGFLL